MKRSIAKAWLCLLLAPMHAWAEVKNPDTFTFLTIGDVDSLDPAWSYDTASHNAIANIYEYLLAYKGTSMTQLEGRLASAVPSRDNGLLSADGRLYAFPIRKGVKFQDGSPLIPEDVKYSLLRFMLFDRDGGPSTLLLEPLLGLQSTRDKDGKLLPGMFQKAERAVAVKGDKVLIRLAKPYAPFLSILASFGAVVSKDWSVKAGAWDGTEESLPKHNNPRKEDSPLMARVNGTGPFALERWDKRTKEIVLSRHDGYWRGPARLKRVFVKVVPEFATRKLMLQAGDADAIYAPQMMFPQVASLPGVQVVDGLENLERGTTLMFTFKINPTANPNIGSGRLDGNGIPPDFFSDIDVRKGFAYCVDAEGYVKDVMRGKGRPARGLVPAGVVGHDPKAPARRLDPKKAEEHFKRAWGGQAWEKGFQFTLMFNDGQPNVIALANMIKNNVEALNPRFRVDVRTVQWSTFLEQKQAHKIPAFVGAWQADYPDPHNLVHPFLHSHGYFAEAQGYADPRLDRLIEEAVGVLDPVRRGGLYRRIQAIAFEETPQVYIADGLRFRTQRSWVKGWRFNPIFPDSPYGSYYFDLFKEGS